MKSLETDLIILDAMAATGDKKAREASSLIKQKLFMITAAGLGYSPPSFRRGDPNFRTEGTPEPKKTKKQLIAERRQRKQPSVNPIKFPSEKAMLKYFEVRDVGTFMPVMCVGMESSDEAEKFLIRRCGYLPGRVILTKLSSAKSQSDPYQWGDSWTTELHKYIMLHWSNLKSGQVIDMQHARGEASNFRTL